ncbi:phage shock envelope stress response protein PspM [Amycolatopsis pigmentata]|uniref:Uncharacterized protein n=1 Tax=Amycolatopsis pigmentata TaxID=450801 RepID=A0ABW5G5I5_9PSEU
MSARRDFGEQLSAKLERHLERLPEYAQRAQETVQRYFPPADGHQRPNPLVRPSARPPRVTDVPLVAEVTTRWARWNEPAAKLERRKRRASRALSLWVVLTLLCVLLGVAGVLAEAAMALMAGAAGVIVFSTLSIRSGMRLRELKRTPVPLRAASPEPLPLPPTSSAAYEPMRRLAECEESLAELLRQLSPSDAVPEVSVDEARTTAQEAARTLRGLAARIQAVERARNASPAGERAALDAAVNTLREQLDDGLDGYGALVAAAGRAVAASTSGMRQSQDALTDATDRLAGLALALRELS